MNAMSESAKPAAASGEARKKLEEVRLEVMAEFRLQDIAIAHRFGRLEIEDLSLVVVVASPHRKEAFQACARIVDRIKESVPIWKKEVFSDGQVWVGCQTHNHSISNLSGAHASHGDKRGAANLGVR